MVRESRVQRKQLGRRLIPADVDRSDDYKAGYEDACKKWADLIVGRLYPNLDPGERWLISDGMSDLLPCIQLEPMAENVALRTERDEYGGVSFCHAPNVQRRAHRLLSRLPRPYANVVIRPAGEPR